MNTEKVIRDHLVRLMDLYHLEIMDTTGKHVGHDQFSGGLHLTAIIVSDTFNTLSLIERHQLVYKALGAMIKKEIHALSMKTFTRSEWSTYVS